MHLYQPDLFDSIFDREITINPAGKTRAIGVSKPRKRRLKEPASLLTESLLPWLFPEDYPELQREIVEQRFVWTDDDIQKVCASLLDLTLRSLFSLKSDFGTKKKRKVVAPDKPKKIRVLKKPKEPKEELPALSTRDEALAWIFFDKGIRPFSFEHVCSELSCSSISLRGEIAARLCKKRDELLMLREDKLLTPAMAAFLSWLEALDWIDDMQPIGAETWQFSPVELQVYYMQIAV